MTKTKIIIPLEDASGDYKFCRFEPCQMSWHSLRKLWEEHSIHYPLCFAPPEDRLEMFFFYACQKYKVPCSLGTVYNPSWTDMFLSKVGHDCLVIAAPLVSYILTNDLFSKHMSKFRLLVLIGSAEAENTRDTITKQFPHLRCELLPHPAVSITA